MDLIINEVFNSKINNVLSVWNDFKNKVNLFWKTNYGFKTDIIESSEPNSKTPLNFTRILWLAIDKKRFNNLITISSKLDSIRLISLRGSKSNTWSTIIPNSSQKLTNAEFKYAFIFTLRGDINKSTLTVKQNQSVFSQNESLDLKAPKCRLCGAIMDAKGLHAIKCNRNFDIARRHNKITEIIAKYMKKADWDILLEKSNLDHKSKSRPADIFLYSDKTNNSNICYDISVPASFSECLKSSSIEKTYGLRVRRCEKLKYQKYKEMIRANNMKFIPLIVECGGLMNKNLQVLIKRISKDISQLKNDLYSTVVSTINYEIFTQIIKSNYLMSISRFI